jgi:RimJ/RimL family protein N-acetyltransferase
MISVAPIGLQPLQGRRVFLERSAPEHALFLQQCYQNDAFMDLYRLAQDRRQTSEQIKERLAKEQKLLPQQLKRIEWVIHLKSDSGENQPVGLISLADYHRTHHRAEFLVGVLPSKHRGTGTALEASLLVLDFAFNQIKLHKVIAYIYGYNHYAQQSVIGLGFTQEGFLREHIYFPKQGFLDIYLNGLTENDFRTNQRLSRLSQRLVGWDITIKPTPPEVLSEEQLAQAKETVRKVISSIIVE